MAWWIWLIGSIVSYFLLGLASAALYAYVEGRGDRSVDSEEITMIVFFWPVIMVMEYGFEFFRWFNNRGKTAIARRVIRQQKKSERQDVSKEIAAFAKEHGIDPKQLVSGKKKVHIPLG